jgi:hypothetical protein
VDDPSGDPLGSDLGGAESATLFGRLSPLLANKWVRSAGLAVAIGGVGLLVARARSSGRETPILIPASSQATAPPPQAEEPPVPAPLPPPLPADPEPAAKGPEAAAQIVPAEEPEPPAEAAGAEKAVVLPSAIASTEGGTPSAIQDPVTPVGQPAGPPAVRRKRPAEKVKATREVGARQRRRVPLLD